MSQSHPRKPFRIWWRLGVGRLENCCGFSRGNQVLTALLGYQAFLGRMELLDLR